MLSSALLAGYGLDQNTAQIQPNKMIEPPHSVESLDHYLAEPVARVFSGP